VNIPKIRFVASILYGQVLLCIGCYFLPRPTLEHISCFLERITDLGKVIGVCIFHTVALACTLGTRGNRVCCSAFDPSI
jgi:hypothetical protein